MKTEILYRPSYSMAHVQLDPNEEIRVEGGAMVSMSSGMSIQTQMKGGVLKSLARSVLGGESFFMNTYRAPATGGEINLAPALPGDMAVLNLQNQGMFIQSGGYVASAPGVNIDTAWAGAKGFFASKDLIMLKATGSGTLILSSYGALHEISLAAGEKYTIDTGHVVAFDEGVGFKVTKVGGLKSTLFSGEGLVVELTGPGRVLMQTRSTDAFLSWLLPRIPKQGGS